MLEPVLDLAEVIARRLGLRGRVVHPFLDGLVILRDLSSELFFSGRFQQEGPGGDENESGGQGRQNGPVEIFRQNDLGFHLAPVGVAGLSAGAGAAGVARFSSLSLYLVMSGEN